MSEIVDPKKPQTDKKKEQGLNLAEVVRILRFRRRYLYVLAGISVFGTLVGHILYLPTFTAQATIVVEENKKSAADYLFRQMNYFDTSQQTEKYVRFLKSNSFYLDVAQSLKFEKDFQRLRFANPKSMTLSKKVFWKKFASRYFSGVKNPDEEINRLDPLLVPIEGVARNLKSVTHIDTDQVQTIKIVVTTLDAYTSMVIANTTAKEFVRLANEHDAKGLMEVDKLIREKLESSANRLKEREMDLVGFKKQNSVIRTSAEGKSFSNRLTSVEIKLENHKLQREEKQRLLSFYIKGQEKALQQIMDSGGREVASNNKKVDNLQAQLADLRQQKELMLTEGFTDDNWRVQTINSKMNKIARILTKAGGPLVSSASVVDPIVARKKIKVLRESLQIIHAKIGSLSTARKSLMKDLESVPEAEQSQLMKTRRVDLEYENFSSLKRKLSEIEIQRISLHKKARLDHVAELPKPTARGNIFFKILFSLFVGLFMGLLIILLLELIDHSVKNKSDFEDYGITFVGEIPNVFSPTKGGLVTNSPQMVVCNENPESIEAMSFKFVRARLESVRARLGITTKSITITSAKNSEGKSFVAANLAVSMSQLDKKIIILDCDFRRPAIHGFFNVPNNHGLTDLFTLKATLDDVVIKNVVPNVDIVPAGWGYPDPTELVSSEKFQILMKHLRHLYDYIIIDAPPVQAMVDAAILSSITDTVLLIAKYRSTARDDLFDAHQRILQISNKQIYGILNNVLDRQSIFKYYGYPYMYSTKDKRDPKPGFKLSDETRKFEQQLKHKKSG